MDAKLLQQLVDARASRQAVAVISNLASGEQQLVRKVDAASHPFGEALEQGFRFDKSAVVEADGTEHFIHIHNPSLQLIIIGAVQIAQGLAPMARAAGYNVTVIDPRGAFATEARFPGVTLHAAWPDEALANIALDGRTAFAALTHDPKIDDPALIEALNSDCFYIGALGSKKTQNARAERLTAGGVDPSRICGPIGLDIGARGGAEIAISVMAEITSHLRKGAAP